MTYSVPNREQRDLTPEEVLADAKGEIASRLETPISGWNFAAFGVGIACMLVGVFGRVAWITIVRHEAYAAAAEANRTRDVVIPARRGLVYDRSGRALLYNAPVLDLVTEPEELPRSPDSQRTLAETLGGLLGLGEAEATALHDTVLLAAATGAKPLLLREAIGDHDAIAVASRTRDLPGVVLRATPARRYAAAEGLYHVLGLVGRVSQKDVDAGYLLSDFVGKEGIEAVYEPYVKGTHGADVYEVNARGEEVRRISHRAAQDGENLVLGVDARLQQIAVAALTRTVKAYRATGGALVAIDPRDGAVRALVSVPGPDGNVLAGGSSAARAAYAAVLQDPAHPLFNRAISARYPAGSTIKPFLGAAAVAEGIVTPRTVINDTGAIAITSMYDPTKSFVFHGYAPLGPVDLYSAIARSSDIYYYTIGGGYGGIKGLGPDRIAKYLGEFGFGSMLGIDLPGEDAGLIPTPAWREAQTGEAWRIGDTYNISIGQGDTGVTVLQLAAGTAAIANGGTLWRPRMVLRTVDASFTTVREFPPEAIHRVAVDPDIIATVRAAMRQTVTAGTARALADLSFTVAGKTGTAQTGRTSRYNALFTAFAPYDAPEIVLAVMVEKAGEGNEVAVPVAREVLQAYFSPPTE